MWLFGYYIVKYNVDINKFDKNPHLPGAFIMIMIGRMILRVYPIVVLSTVVARFSILIFIVFWYSFTSFEGRVQRVLYRFSTYSFGVYIFHELLLTFFRKIIIRILGVDLHILIIEGLFLPLIVFSLAILFSYSLKRVFPYIYSVLTGARI